MALSVKHAFESAKGDGVDTTVVRPSNWNAEHTLLMATARILGRKTASTGAVEELDLTDSATRTAIGLGALAALATAGTAQIDNDAVTYAKLQNISATLRLLGRYSSGAGDAEEISIGAGLTVSAAGAIAAGFAPPGSFKNLSIKVASDTTITVAADWVATTNGTTFQTTAVSSTVNMFTTGVDALDTGSIATSQWYYLWVIAKADGTTKVIASLQSTANATFLSNLAAIASGAYTFYARIGAVRTAAGIAQLLGTWQYGRIAQYVRGLAQTTAPRIMQSGITGSSSVPIWSDIATGAFVPATASSIHGVLYSAPSASAPAILAPNNTYGAAGSLTNPPPVEAYGISATARTSVPFQMILESSNIYMASDSNSKPVLVCTGWEDNI